jgi:hypothetical protein
MVLCIEPEKIYSLAGCHKIVFYLGIYNTILAFLETHSRWSNLAKFLRARNVSGHLTESGQFFELQARRKCNPAVLGENFLNMTSVIEFKDKDRI